MEFEEFYSYIKDMNALDFYRKAGDLFLSLAEKYDYRNKPSLRERLKYPEFDLNERARQYANGPFMASDILEMNKKTDLKVFEHILIDPETGIPLIEDIYRGFKDFKIPPFELFYPN